MVSMRFALLALVACLAACDAPQPGATAAPEKPVADRAATTAAPAAVSPEAFIAALDLPATFQVTAQREVPGKRGRVAHVYSIEYTEGRVASVDRQLAAALKAAGFKRGKATKVSGGVRVPYAAADGRKVSTKIRNKKYMKDRIAAGSAGQVSLTYALPR